MESHLKFSYEDVDFRMDDSYKVVEWMKIVLEEEKLSLDFLNIIFCSDEYLLEINKKYLNHYYYTDIITFDYSEEIISGDCFISIDRIKDNALIFHETFERELKRVIVHGLLHLMGYNDKSQEEKDVMTGKEDYYLGK